MTTEHHSYLDERDHIQTLITSTRLEIAEAETPAYLNQLHSELDSLYRELADLTPGTAGNDPF